MSRWSDTSDEDRRRDERREYESNVFYEVWRSGRNPDCIDHDRVSDSYYNGASAEDAASREIHAQQATEHRRYEEAQYAAYLEEQERQHYEALDEEYRAQMAVEQPPQEPLPTEIHLPPT